MVVCCVHGHNLSQGAAAMLRSAGLRARALRGGIEAFVQAGGVTTALRAGAEPSCWVTGEDLSVDGLACAWLIRRFFDSRARILQVEAGQVAAVAESSMSRT